MTKYLKLSVVCVLLILPFLLTACADEPARTSVPEPAPPVETQPEQIVLPSKIPDASPVKPEESTPAPVNEPPKYTAPPKTTMERTEDAQTVISPDFIPTLAGHFGFMPAFIDFKGARDAGGDYDRPHFELFQWGMIEKDPGFFDFFETDDYVRRAQSYNQHILANIQPYAQWDQEKCHQDLPPAEESRNPDWAPTKGKPCDMEGYRNFVVKLVERYDGDGIDDMPGLIFPIKHWEVMNEPEFCTGDLIFFQGDAADYFDILKTTYEAVKSADPEAYVVQGGMAGMMDIDIAFWQQVFDMGGADYLDIMNMHSIGHGEHLNIPAFKKLLADNAITDKPVWVTEVQYQQSHRTQNYTNEDFARILARSYVFALANGVDKLFYVNIKMPSKVGEDKGPPFDERSALVQDNGDRSALFHAHLAVATLLGDLETDDTVEIIREEVGEWHIEKGQYKFVIDGRTVYALWGTGSLPGGITGDVRVVDITGTETITDAASLSLSDSPFFIIIE